MSISGLATCLSVLPLEEQGNDASKPAPTQLVQERQCIQSSLQQCLEDLGKRSGLEVESQA